MKKKVDSELKFEDFLKSIDWFRPLNLEKNEDLKSSNYKEDYKILKKILVKWKKDLLL